MVNREMAVGNTFGATALSSYGGFWLSFAIILTPGFAIETSLEGPDGSLTDFHNSFSLFLWVRFRPQEASNQLTQHRDGSSSRQSS